MAAKYSPMTIYPDPKLRKKIEEQAAKENRARGNWICETLRQYFAAKEATQG
jgi:hypothetical protein